MPPLREQQEMEVVPTMKVEEIYEGILLSLVAENISGKNDSKIATVIRPQS